MASSPNFFYYFKDSLRDYQSELLKLLLAAALNGTDTAYSQEHQRVSPLVYLPTGAGKTRLATALMFSWLYHFPSARCAFLVNRRTLLQQGHEAISAAAKRWHTTPAGQSHSSAQGDDLPPAVGIIGGGSDCFPGAQLVVCSVQALQAARRRAAAAADQSAHSSAALLSASPASTTCSGNAQHEDDDMPGAVSAPAEAVSTPPCPSMPPQRRSPPPLPNFDLVIVDEAHAAYAAQYSQMLGELRARGAFVVGLTATPLRSNVRPPRHAHLLTQHQMRSQPFERLGRVFSHLLMGPGVNSLTEGGVLVPPRHVAVHQVRQAKLGQ